MIARSVRSLPRLRLPFGLALPSAVALALSVAACDESGGDGGSDGAQGPGQTTDGECPPLAESLERSNRASWAVYGELTLQTPQGPAKQYLPIGTAWAVDRRLLVSNAHVTEAFVDYARQGVQFDRALAVQAQTGREVELLRQLTHPDYSGDPLRSPDVGLFTTRDEMADLLPLAADDVMIALGDDVQIVGFPGDVSEFIQITPGTTIPQATSLNGQVTALRSHDDTQQVTAENLDVIQHQAPTTPGTSGSSMVSCGLVIGVNNAGTVKLVVTPGPDGSLQVDRQAAAANNFAVHVRHIRDMLELFADNALQGEELPVDAGAGPIAGSGGDPSGGDPSGGETGGVDPSGGESGGDPPDPTEATVLSGQVADPYPHLFRIAITSDGLVSGTSTWNDATFNLAGQAFTDGSIVFVDDAFEVSGGTLARGIYEAVIVSDTTIEGFYYEEGQESVAAPLQAVLE